MHRGCYQAAECALFFVNLTTFVGPIILLLVSCLLILCLKRKKLYYKSVRFKKSKPFSKDSGLFQVLSFQFMTLGK